MPDLKELESILDDAGLEGAVREAARQHFQPFVGGSIDPGELTVMVYYFAQGFQSGVKWLDQNLVKA